LVLRGTGDTIVLSPPLIVTETEVDELIVRLTRAMERAAAFAAAARV
jgi:adenosylmethionine-8-amino-7-oxononanoate aminotransferase